MEFDFQTATDEGAMLEAGTRYFQTMQSVFDVAKIYIPNDATGRLRGRCTTCSLLHQVQRRALRWPGTQSEQVHCIDGLSEIR